MTNDNMNIDEILQAASSISNSLYRLRRDGKIDRFDDDVYHLLRQTINDFYNGFAWEILLSNSKNRTEK